jgi:hypothetical protein
MIELIILILIISLVTGCSLADALGFVIGAGLSLLALATVAFFVIAIVHS